MLPGSAPSSEEASAPAGDPTLHAPRTTLHAPLTTHHVFRFLLSFLTPFLPRILLSVLLGFATIASGIGLMGASAWIIASAALGPSIASLQVAIVGVRFFGIARGFARYGERLASHDVTFRVLARLRVWFYAAIEPMAPARLASQHTADLLSRIVGDINALESFYLRAMAPAAIAALTALLSACLVGRADPRLAAALLLLLAAGGIGAPLLARFLGRQPGRRLAPARGELNIALVDGIQGMADLIAFGGARAQLDRVRALSLSFDSLQQRITSIGGLNGALIALCTALAALAMVTGAAPLVAGGALSGVNLPVLVMIAIASFEAVIPLPAAAQHLESSLEAGRRLLSLAEAPATLAQPPATEVAATDRSNDFSRPIPASSTTPHITVENLSFRYAEDEPWVLRDVSFTLRAGERLAIVGPSGSGKTTLVNLLLRFWDPPVGCIRLAGRDLRASDPEEVRRSFSVVSQNTYLFSGAIRDNLLLARPGASQAELDEATARAQLAGFIRSLPEGYDTWIGEHGLRLSGGERQRLAIARALLKDAPIQILDEPVANLDAATGRAILEASRMLISGRSLLFITHSPIGLEEADQVLVLREGSIVEQGRPAELAARRGWYYRMWMGEQGVLEE